MCYGGEFHNHIIMKLYDRILLGRKVKEGFPSELTLELLSEGLRCQPSKDSPGNKTMAGDTMKRRLLFYSKGKRGMVRMREGIRKALILLVIF